MARTSHFDLHACGRGHARVVASPVLAQAPPDPSSSRADLLGDARDSLTGQSVPPGRSTVERGLYWYDNQYVLAKLFGGWKGIHLAGGDFPPAPASRSASATTRH